MTEWHQSDPLPIQRWLQTTVFAQSIRCVNPIKIEAILHPISLPKE
jgi:hypothetical protein